MTLVESTNSEGINKIFSAVDEFVTSRTGMLNYQKYSRNTPVLHVLIGDKTCSENQDRVRISLFLFSGALFRQIECENLFHLDNRF